jgi:hypothetical protein
MDRSSPVPLTVTALEQLNNSLQKIPGSACSRWLETQHPSLDFDSLPLAPPRDESLSRHPDKNESHLMAPPKGPETTQAPQKVSKEVQDLSAKAFDQVAATHESSPTKFIVSTHRTCERSLTQLLHLLDESLQLPQIFRDDVGRFEVWTANSGAHRDDRLSLDHRLRESVNLKEMVIDMLEDLNSALQEGKRQACTSA